MIQLEETKSYVIKPSVGNKLNIETTDLVEIKVEKLSNTGKYAKINILFTEQKPKTIWTLTYHLKPLVVDVIVY